MKIFYIVSWITIVSTLAFLLTMIFWMVYPYRTLEFKYDKFPVNPKVVKAGESLVYTTDYCKYINEDAVVTRAFVDEIVYSLQSSISDRPMGCHKSEILLDIPKSLNPDTYYLQIKYVYKVNPLREIVLIKQTEEFQIIK